VNLNVFFTRTKSPTQRTAMNDWRLKKGALNFRLLPETLSQRMMLKAALRVVSETNTSTSANNSSPSSAVRRENGKENDEWQASGEENVLCNEDDEDHVAIAKRVIATRRSFLKYGAQSAFEEKRAITRERRFQPWHRHEEDSVTCWAREISPQQPKKFSNRMNETFAQKIARQAAETARQAEETARQVEERDANIRKQIAEIDQLLQDKKDAQASGVAMKVDKESPTKDELNKKRAALDAQLYQPPQQLAQAQSPVAPVTRGALSFSPLAAPAVSSSSSIDEARNSYRGKLYGKCKESNCECEEYDRDPVNSACVACGHRPLQHVKKL